MIEFVLLFFQLLILAYFCYFAFYNYYYTIASFFYKPPKKVKIDDSSKVAVVIVSFNEQEVLMDTVESCEQLTYSNKTIIVGDDSNDGVTYPLLVEMAKLRGCKRFHAPYVDDSRHEVWTSENFVLFHRKTNDGFKAGNLKEIESFLKDHHFDYMYLLDADWHPQEDTLEQCLCVIQADDTLAYVQTKRRSYHGVMDHLQRCLALNEDGCYYVDLVGRDAVGDPVLFTGCCTLFHLPALYAVEGFLPGHLTEDIDLTNRFYLAGYKAVYLNYVVNEGEVPFHYHSVCKQQDRWAMGSARTLKDYFFPILKSSVLTWREKSGMIRQNSYFTTAVVIELSILLSVLSLVWVSFSSDSISAMLYFYYLQKIGYWYTLVLFFALLSNFAPLLVTSLRRHKLNLLFIPYATWLSWSLLHTYFWANIKGLWGVKSTWFKTPKHNRKKTKQTHPFCWELKIANCFTLLLLLGLYALEWTEFGWIDPYAYFWVPAMVIGIVFS